MRGKITICWMTARSRGRLHPVTCNTGTSPGPRRLRSTLIFICAVAMTSAAQTAGASPGQGSTPAESAAPQAAEASAPGDIQVLAELKQSLNTKKIHVGDPVKATVTQDVLIHGKIALARGSKLVGHVTETKIRGENDKESCIGLVFDKALLKDGREIQFNGTIAALAAPARMTIAEPDPMLSPPQGIVRDQVGGPQQAPAIGGPPRGTTSPNADTPLNPANSTIGNAARISRETGNAGDSTSGGGLMSAGSRGVFGLPGLTLRTEPAGGHGSVVSSLNHNVVLESGTQMLVQVTIPIREQ